MSAFGKSEKEREPRRGAAGGRSKKRAKWKRMNNEEK